MPKLNRWLLTSMIADLKELVAVSNEMCSWIGKVEYLSWRFPTRFARNVNAIGVVQQHNGSAGEMYILLLEMAYDRMNFVLRLVVEFIEGHSLIGDFLKGAVNKKKSRRKMSLANVVRILWCRLKSIPETSTRNTTRVKHLNQGSVVSDRMSCGCQASGSLSFCESCSHAAKAITDLSDIVSATLCGSNLSSEVLRVREDIRADIFESTQWAVMTKLVQAIDTDIKNLLDFVSETEVEKKEREKTARSLDEELEKQRTEKSSLELKIAETIDRMRIVEGQLERTQNRYTESVEENKTLVESLSKAEEKSSNSEAFLEIVFRQIAEIGESKLAWENTVKQLRDEVRATRDASSSETKSLQKSLDQLREEKISLEEHHREELKNLKQEHSKIVEKLQEDAKSKLHFASTNIERCNRETVAVKITEDKTSADISTTKGDPEIDMRQQLTTNQELIDKLMRQNERLSRTLNLIEEHRRNSVDTKP